MKTFLKRDLQARGCNPLSPNWPAHSAGPTPLDHSIGPFLLQNRCSTFREGSLGPHWPLTKNKRGSLGLPWPKTLTFLPPWDAPESAQGENRNHQNTPGFIVLFCKGTYLGRSRGAPLAPKKNETIVPGAPRDPKARRHASQGAPRDLQGAKTIVFELMLTAPGALLEPYCEKTLLFENHQKI